MSPAEQTPEQDAATRAAQQEMCLPEWEDDETRAGNAYYPREESGW